MKEYYSKDRSSSYKLFLFAAISFMLVMFSTLVHGQDSEYLKLWDQYVDECNEIVLDTLTESGTVTYEISDEAGELKLVPKDTVWNIMECPEYKLYPLEFGGGFVLSSSLFTTTENTYLVSEPIKNEFTSEIERMKICECKLTLPSRDDFWQWLKDNRYRK